MKLTRREFIKAALAAATVAHIPLSVAEAEEAYEAFGAGIEDLGNGWFRVHMSFTADGTPQRFSTMAKAGSANHLQLSHGKIRQWFDLETGELGSMDIVDDEHTGVTAISPAGEGDNLYIGHSQLEITKAAEYIESGFTVGKE